MLSLLADNGIQLRVIMLVKKYLTLPFVAFSVIAPYWIEYIQIFLY